MTLAVFAVSRYLIVMLFCVTAYVIGRASLQRLPFASRAEEIALCTAFGLGVLSQIILIVGLFGWLTMGGIIVVMGVLQLFYSDAPGPAGHLSLAPDGNLNVHCEQRRYGAVERLLIKSFCALGFWSFPFLVRYGEPGGSFHYAGTLPMSHRETTRGLATDPMGRLQRARMVFAIDASTFPLLPAKNLSLTIMNWLCG